MAGAIKNFIGREGFIWFVGVVEDRMDPQQLGRLRVRCFGWHTDDKSQIPTADLPWAHPVIPVNSPASYTAKEGDMVFGFFMDAESAQNPVVVGVFPGKPLTKPNYNKGFSDPRTDFGSAPTDEPYPLKKKINEPSNSRLARGRVDGTIVEKRKRALKKGIKTAAKSTWNEPAPAFAPKYPYNNAIETESGHAFELDDTKNNERVALYHKAGTFFEIDKDGNKVEKVIKNGYTLIMGEDYVYVEGNCNKTVGGNCNLKSVGKLNIEASEINMSSGGDVKIKAAGKLKLESGGTTDVKSGGAAKIGSGGKLSLKGSNATLQGSNLSLSGKITNKVKIPPGTDKRGGIGKILTNGSAETPTATGLETPQ
jgi:hypothetical protein